MASATGIPENVSAFRRNGEEEPLLGRPGDVAQQEGKPMAYNLVSGTAVLAQVGIWMLLGIVWVSVLSHKLILFSAHPMLNSAGLLILTQAALILQPTHTPTQKRQGAYIHAALVYLGLTCFLCGLIIIEVNKSRNKLPHFESAHSVLGTLTLVFMLVQASIGFTQFFTPQLYGGEEKAKKIYKYHRVFGYTIVVLALGTVAAATRTHFVISALHIPLWAVVIAAVITLVGVVPRIKKEKLGFATGGGRQPLFASSAER